ncbi:MAG: small multi-drug export protein [Clostridia bacterium]|nr:small multi-drug export protein [Clostridia bacterium]
MVKLMFISALPIIELRGGLPVAAASGIHPAVAYFLCVIGNLLPVPFIILLWAKVFKFFKRGKFKELLEKIQAKADEKKEKVLKYEKWGLYIFVALPLPGTGAWTGALIAATLEMKLKDAFPVILAGVLTAGIIMTIVSYGGAAILTSIF